MTSPGLDDRTCAGSAVLLLLLFLLLLLLLLSPSHMHHHQHHSHHHLHPRPHHAPHSTTSSFHRPTQTPPACRPEKSKHRHSGCIGSVVVSGDGGWMCTASSDKSVRVWSMEDGACVATLTGHTNYVCQAVFTPDGASILSASNDGTAKVWGCASLVAVSTPSPPSPMLSSAELSTEARSRLATPVRATPLDHGTARATSQRAPRVWMWHALVVIAALAWAIQGWCMMIHRDGV